MSARHERSYSMPGRQTRMSMLRRRMIKSPLRFLTNDAKGKAFREYIVETGIYEMVADGLVSLLKNRDSHSESESMLSNLRESFMAHSTVERKRERLEHNLEELMRMMSELEEEYVYLKEKLDEISTLDLEEDSFSITLDAMPKPSTNVLFKRDWTIISPPTSRPSTNSLFTSKTVIGNKSKTRQPSSARSSINQKTSTAKPKWDSYSNSNATGSPKTSISQNM